MQAIDSQQKRFADRKSQSLIAVADLALARVSRHVFLRYGQPTRVTPGGISV